jgi:hypothetical protein
MGQDLEQILSQIVGLPCSRAQNPFGSTLTLDFGELILPKDALPKEKPRGWRRLTVYSPWRVQDDREILFDWNVDGGTRGMLPALVQMLVGSTVNSAATTLPAWDLTVDLSNGLRLCVFGDFDDAREAAWFITGSDGMAISARPRARPLPKTGSLNSG